MDEAFICEMCGVEIDFFLEGLHICPIKHIEVELYECHFKYVNCKFRGTHQDLNIHLKEESQYHLQLLAAKMLEQNQRLSIAENKLSALEKNCESSRTYYNSYIWRITDWDKNMEDSQSRKIGYLDSPMFYSHPHGYKIKVYLRPNGWGLRKGKHLTVDMQIVAGEYDSRLSWPFKNKVSFILLNQTGGADYSKTLDPAQINSEEERGNNCFERPDEFANYSFGYNQFISHDQLNNAQFIKDDCISIKFQFDN